MATRAPQRLPEKVATAAVEFIYESLAENPKRVGKPLRFELEGLHSARRGDYWVDYEIDHNRSWSPPSPSSTEPTSTAGAEPPGTGTR